jgi:hypothetical protein
MFRALGLLGLLIALLMVGVLLKHQLAATHQPAAAAAASANEVGASTPDVRTPAQGRQVQQQVQDDMNRTMQEHSKQIDQSVERNAP